MYEDKETRRKRWRRRRKRRRMRRKRKIIIELCSGYLNKESH